MKHDVNKAASAIDLEALALSGPILGSPADFARTDHLPDWPVREPRRVQAGSPTLRWVVAILVAGLVGAALMTPTPNGGTPEGPAYMVD